MGKELPEKDKRIAIALLKKIQDAATNRHERNTAKKLLLKRLKKYDWTYEEFVEYQTIYGTRDEKISDFFSDLEKSLNSRRAKRKAKPLTREEKEEVERLTKEFLDSLGRIKTSVLKTFFRCSLALFILTAIACAAIIL